MDVYSKFKYEADSYNRYKFLECNLYVASGEKCIQRSHNKPMGAFQITKAARKEANSGKPKFKVKNVIGITYSTGCK